MRSMKKRPLLPIMALMLVILACSPLTTGETKEDLEPMVDMLSTIEALENEVKALNEDQLDSPLPFEGLWIQENAGSVITKSILVISGESFYHIEVLESGDPNNPTYLRETYAEIVSYDLDTNHLVLRILAIRINGGPAGFDYPTATITYAVNDDEFRFAVLRLDETQFPEEVDSEIYYRK